MLARRRRHLITLLIELLGESRVVVVGGARQCGKTTLVQALREEVGGSYLTLDDQATLEAARTDPVGLVSSFDEPVIIDEVQRGGDALLLAVKAAVDRSPRVGRFVLTGSTDFLRVPTLSESLAGRVALLDLHPFSRGEVLGQVEGFWDTAFSEPESLRRLGEQAMTPRDYLELACVGGFPEVQERARRGRARWFRDYVRTVTERDVRDLARVRRLAELPALVKLLAARTATVMNVSELARDARIPQATLRDYVALLEAVYLIGHLPAWSKNLTSRVAKRPKLHFVDSGLAASLHGLDPTGLGLPSSNAAGRVVETYVVGELSRQRGWAEVDVTLHHFRDRNGAEVDVVAETPDGRVVGVEVKAGASVVARDFRWLAKMRDALGDRFVHGFVVYGGARAMPFGDRMTVVPISGLWDGSLGGGLR